MYMMWILVVYADGNWCNKATNTESSDKVLMVLNGIFTTNALSSPVYNVNNVLYGWNIIYFKL